MKNIVLYGMRGSGKTTLGKKLSQKLGIIFYDLDLEIEKNIGETIYTFIEREGWDSFRKKESEILKTIIFQEQDKVISLGGGTLFFEDNLDFLLKKADKLIFIETTLENIAKRILKDEEKGNKRNLLTNKGLIEELGEVYKIREHVYISNYDFKIENNGDLETSLNQIIKNIKIGNICLPISDFSNQKLLADINTINQTNLIKFVELRIDFLNIDEIEEKLNLLKQIKKQIIITNRSYHEGGKFELDFLNSIKKISKFKEIGEYFDIELLAGEEINILKKSIGEKKLIISYHNFEKTPDFDFLIAKINQMSKYSPNVYKIAVMPHDKKDVEVIYKLQEYFENNYRGRDYIFISMGDLGNQSRIDIPKKGGLLTFACLAGKKTAPGQIDYKELYKKLY